MQPTILIRWLLCDKGLVLKRLSDLDIVFLFKFCNIFHIYFLLIMRNLTHTLPYNPLSIYERGEKETMKEEKSLHARPCISTLEIRKTFWD